MLHSLCLHHLCWIVKRLLSSDNFFREAEPETTKNNWIVVGVAFLGWTLWLAFRALLYLLSFGVCESHCDKNFKKSRFHWLSRQFLFTELCREPICNWGATSWCSGLATGSGNTGEICMEKMTRAAHSKAPIFVWKPGGWLVKQAKLFWKH